MKAYRNEDSKPRENFLFYANPEERSGHMVKHVHWTQYMETPRIHMETQIGR